MSTTPSSTLDLSPDPSGSRLSTSLSQPNSKPSMAKTKRTKSPTSSHDQEVDQEEENVERGREEIVRKVIGKSSININSKASNSKRMRTIERPSQAAKKPKAVLASRTTARCARNGTSKASVSKIVKTHKVTYLIPNTQLTTRPPLETGWPNAAAVLLQQITEGSGRDLAMLGHHLLQNHPTLPQKSRKSPFKTNNQQNRK
jgi:hypothetical protein